MSKRNKLKTYLNQKVTLSVRQLKARRSLNEATYDKAKNGCGLKSMQTGSTI